MNTAQVSVELVLAGILGLCAFVLPFFPGTDISADLLQNEALIGILGLAYLLGVIFDKLADSLLNPREHYLRLKQAAKNLVRIKDLKGSDPFPQDNLEYLLKKEKDGRLDWMNSLKSRIRTSRELTVLGLPATLGIILQLGDSMPWMYASIGLNLLFITSPLWRQLIAPGEGSQKSNQTTWRHTRTDDISKSEKDRKTQLENLKKQMHLDSIPYYLLLAVSTISIAIMSLLNPENSFIPLFGAGGLIISLLAWWTCERIMGTYFEFISRELTTILNVNKK